MNDKIGAMVATVTDLSILCPYEYIFLKFAWEKGRLWYVNIIMHINDLSGVQIIKPRQGYICYVYVICSFWMHSDDYFQPIDVLLMDRLPRFVY